MGNTIDVIAQFPQETTKSVLALERFELVPSPHRFMFLWIESVLQQHQLTNILPSASTDQCWGSSPKPFPKQWYPMLVWAAEHQPLSGNKRRIWGDHLCECTPWNNTISSSWSFESSDKTRSPLTFAANQASPNLLLEDPQIIVPSKRLGN